MVFPGLVGGGRLPDGELGSSSDFCFVWDDVRAGGQIWSTESDTLWLFFIKNLFFSDPGSLKRRRRSTVDAPAPLRPQQSRCPSGIFSTSNDVAIATKNTARVRRRSKILLLSVCHIFIPFSSLRK